MRYILLTIFSLALVTACTTVAITPTSTSTLPLLTPTPTSTPPPPTPTPDWGIAFAAVSSDMTTGPGPVWPLSLHLIHRDGSRLTPLTGEMEYITNLTASPDGRHLLFAAYREDTDGDGSAGSIDLPHLYIVSVQTGEIVTLTNGSTSMERVAAWSPDGERIVFASSEVNANNRVHVTESHTYLYVINRDGTGKVKLTPQEGMIQAVAWSPTGEWIAFDQNRAVWVVKPDGSDLLRVADASIADWHSYTAQPVWSPDSSQIVFVAPGIEDSGDIFVANADGSGLFNLTADPSEEFEPAWSPDGQSIVFVRTQVGEEWGLYVINVDDNTITSVFRSTTRGVSTPVWSPDGSQVAFISASSETWEESLLVTALTSTSTRQLTENVWGRPAWVLMPTH